MFRPCKVIFRQLFTNWNCRTAPVGMLVHPMLLHIVARTKMCLFGNEHTLFAARYFHFAAPMLRPLRVWFSLVGRETKITRSEVCVFILKQTRLAGLRWRYSNPPPHGETFPLDSSVFKGFSRNMGHACPGDVSEETDARECVWLRSHVSSFGDFIRNTANVSLSTLFRRTGSDEFLVPMAFNSLKHEFLQHNIKTIKYILQEVMLCILQTRKLLQPNWEHKSSLHTFAYMAHVSAWPAIVSHLLTHGPPDQQQRHIPHNRKK
jgi:hypothetical protein